MAEAKVATIQYAVVTQDELRAFVQEALVEARELVIDSDDMYEIAGELLTKIKGRQQALDKQRRSIVDPLNLAVKNTNALFKAPMDAAESAESVLKIGMAGWVRYKQEEERIARQKAAQQAALKQARLDAEAQAAQEAAEEAEGTPQAQAAQVAAQEAAEAAAMPVAPALTLPAKAKAAGVSNRKKYVGDVLDMQKLFQYCAENPEWQSLFEFKQGALNKKAQALGPALKLPGVVVREDVVIAAKAA